MHDKRWPTLCSFISRERRVAAWLRHVRQDYDPDCDQGNKVKSNVRSHFDSPSAVAARCKVVSHGSHDDDGLV